jgi:hypothetical protein
LQLYQDFTIAQTLAEICAMGGDSEPDDNDDKEQITKKQPQLHWEAKRLSFKHSQTPTKQKIDQASREKNPKPLSNLPKDLTGSPEEEPSGGLYEQVFVSSYRLREEDLKLWLAAAFGQYNFRIISFQHNRYLMKLPRRLTSVRIPTAPETTPN